jgi:hypothetical protein
MKLTAAQQERCLPRLPYQQQQQPPPPPPPPPPQKPPLLNPQPLPPS